MPYYHLGNLHSVDGSRGFSTAEKKEATRQILDGLRHLHNLEIIHRDIKPENIFVQSVQPLNIVIGDFGQVSLWKPVTYVGTPFYRAPEIYINCMVNEPYTKAVDIYSVGMLVVFLFKRMISRKQIDPRRLLTEDNHNEVIGSRILKALQRHPTGDVQDALTMAHMMTRWNPLARPTADQCLGLHWLRPEQQMTASAVSPSRLSQRTQTNSPRRSLRIAESVRPAGPGPKKSKERARSNQKFSDPMDID